jgi:hypothetical protein
MYSEVNSGGVVESNVSKLVFIIYQSAETSSNSFYIYVLGPSAETSFGVCFTVGFGTLRHFAGAGTSPVTNGISVDAQPLENHPPKCPGIAFFLPLSGWSKEHRCPWQALLIRSIFERGAGTLGGRPGSQGIVAQLVKP